MAIQPYIKNVLWILMMLVACRVSAQTGIGTTTPNASAKLDVYATNKGFLPPRVTLLSTTDVATISSPATGLLIYNTATSGSAPNNVLPGYYYFNGTNWVQLTSGLIIDNSKSTSFNLAPTDNNKIFLITSSSATIITVPTGLTVGFSCQFIQGGTGQIILAAGSGVTLNSSNGLSSRTINSVMGLIMNTTTTAFVFGDSVF